MSATAQDPIVEDLFELCKEQASVDGVFSDRLLRQWFEAALELCADKIGFVWPPRHISEPIIVRPDGSFRLSHKPASEVRIYDGATLVMTLPRSLERNLCQPMLCACCACCGLTAQYWIGEESCGFKPTFKQAVMLAFTYFAENRGDTGAEANVLARSGAWALLADDATYVL